MDILTLKERMLVQHFVAHPEKLGTPHQLARAAPHAENEMPLRELASVAREMHAILVRVTGNSAILDHVQRMMEETRIVELRRLSADTANKVEQEYPDPGDRSLVQATVFDGDFQEPRDTICTEKLGEIFSRMFVCWCNGEPPCAYNCPELSKGGVFDREET